MSHANLKLLIELTVFGFKFQKQSYIEEISVAGKESVAIEKNTLAAASSTPTTSENMRKKSMATAIRDAEL